MTTDKNIENKLEELGQAIGSDELMVEKIMTHIDAEPISESKPIAWRFIMNHLTKFAAAAVIIAAITLSISFWDKSMPTAYALNQTIEANDSVRYIHIKSFTPSHNEPKEYWVECKESGKLKCARWHMPEWDSPEDGAKVVVWKENKIQLWFKGTIKRNGCLVTYKEANGADWLYNRAQESNPRLAVERLYEQQAQGKVKIQVDQPEDNAKPIVVTATYLPESPTYGKREVLFVDRNTKLVTATEFHRLKNGKYKYQYTHEYHNYNQPIDPAMFDLEKEVPTDVKRVDRDLKKTDMNKGISPDELEKYEKMTPKEMTIAFFQACVDEDWDELLKFNSDLELKQETKDFYGGLEIISIGEPFKTDDYHGCFVPYELRLKSGEIKKWNLAVTNKNEAQRCMLDGGF